MNRLIPGSVFVKMDFKENKRCETCTQWTCLIVGTNLDPGHQPMELYYGKCSRFPHAITHWVMSCGNHEHKVKK